MSITPPTTRPDPVAPFTDARRCREWLGTLALTNVAQAQAMLADGLRGLNAASMDGLESLKCLELAAMEKMRIPSTVVVPAGLTTRGRGLEVMEGGERRELTVHEVLDRGTDFDRVTLF